MYVISLLKTFGMYLFRALPIETIVAKIFTYLLGKIKNIDELNKVNKTLQHITESVDLVSSIVADATVTGDEVTLIKNDISQLKASIIELWSKGESAKTLQDQLPIEK